VVQSQGVDVAVQFALARDDRLVDVTVEDVLFGRPDGVLVLVLRACRLAVPDERAAGGRVGVGQQLGDAVGLSRQVVVDSVDVVVGPHDRREHQRERLGDFVEHQRLRVEDELGVGEPRVGALHAHLVQPEVVNGVVCEEADQTAVQLSAVAVLESRERRVG